jgi:hypothetical protein
VSERILFAIEWILATTIALGFTHLIVEILGAAVFGWTLLLLLPFIAGAIGGLPVGALQSFVLRRRLGDSGSWLPYTLIGFMGSWAASMVLAAALFVPSEGLSSTKAFVSFALPTPIIGIAQTRVLRRWTARTTAWVVLTAAAWTGLAAVEVFSMDALDIVNRWSGRLVSAVAGYSTGSTLGATLLGGALAGSVTGIALAIMVQPSRGDSHRMPASA